MRRTTKTTITLACALLVAGLVALATRPDPVPVELGPVVRGAFRVTIDEDGKTRVRDRFVVSAPLSGQVGRIELRAGDAVDAGEVLARIVPVDPPLLDARSRAEAKARVRAQEALLSRAEAAAEQAQVARDLAAREAERARLLARENNVARQVLERVEAEARSRAKELESATFGARVAAYELEVARANLVRSSGRGDERWDVRAPAAGRVLRVLRESAGVVAAGTPLVELGDPAALEVVVDLLTTDAVSVEPGAEATIERWGGASPLPARVRRVEPSATTKISALGVEEQRVDVILDLDAPRELWRGLGDGFRVEASILVYARPEALQVPASALFRADDRWHVFVQRDARAVEVPVEVGRSNGTSSELARGLAEGDLVVLHPSDRVASGVRITPRAVSSGDR